MQDDRSTEAQLSVQVRSHIGMTVKDASPWEDNDDDKDDDDDDDDDVNDDNDEDARVPCRSSSPLSVISTAGLLTLPRGLREVDPLFRSAGAECRRLRKGDLHPAKCTRNPSIRNSWSRANRLQQRK